MKTSNVLAFSVFVLITGTCLYFVLSMVSEKRSCDSAIQQQLQQLKLNPSAKLGDLSAACANPTAQAVDRIISTR